ncbi:MAG: AMP-binding protein [Candidatus Zhuqueibacterota bacterium]
MKFGLTKYTLDEFFQKVIEKYSDRPALALIGQEPITYHQFGQRVDLLKQRLRDLGIREGNRIAILGRSSTNWATAFMAIMTMGAVAVPILEDFPESDIDHIIRHAEVKAIFIAGNLHQDLTLPSLGKNKIVLNLDDLTLLSDAPPLMKVWHQIQDAPQKIARLFEKEFPASHIAANSTIAEDDVAEILYTSGTTGHSKGVILTNKNLVSNLFEGPDLLGVINDRSVVLSFLPMAHAFGSTSGFLSIIYCGACIYFLDKRPSPKLLLDAMQKVRPTIIGGVPLIFEKIYHKRVVPALSSNRLMRSISALPRLRKWLYRAIGKKVMRSFGGRLECAIIGGASLSHEVEIFLREGNIPYALGYGLSECSPLVTFSSMTEVKIGSVGHAISDVSIKIVEKEPATGIGEILVKGPNVMKGYFKNDAETARVFTSDGWFITGDRGYLDDDGFLFITGRSKNVIIGPSGENVYPEIIESKFMESLFVEEVLVYPDQNQLIARVYPDYGYIQSRIAGKDESALAADITSILEDVKKAVNKQLPQASRVHKVYEQTEPFIKTPTNKIKRGEYFPAYCAQGS